MSTRLTRGYEAKRALIARLKALSGLPGTALSDVQVQYAAKMSTMRSVCVYGGTIAFEQPGEEDAYAGPMDRLVKETATIGLHIRVSVSPPAAVAEGSGEPEGTEVTDMRAEQIGNTVAELLMAEPALAGDRAVVAIVAGLGDYSPNDDADVSTLSLRVAVESYLS